MDKVNRNDKMDRERAFDTSMPKDSAMGVSHDQDSSALRRQQHLNEAKQRSGKINSEAGLAAEFGNNRQVGFPDVDLSRDSTQLPADRMGAGRTAAQDTRPAWNASMGDSARDRDVAGTSAGAGMKGDQSWDREAKLSKDLISKDRELTDNVSGWAAQENKRDHLAEAWGTNANIGARADDRDFQTDKSANAMSRGQMADASRDVAYNTASNPLKEVGGPDHLSTGWGITPDTRETRDFQTDKSANALSRNQMADIDKNASYRNTTNPAQEIGGVDHLQRRWDAGADDRDFQTDKSANALSRDQMAAIDKNASYRTTTNPDKEVGGVDHVSQSRPADIQAQNRNYRS